MPPVRSNLSLLLPAEAAKTPSNYKIHILGDDMRSRFIAHTLSTVYDSVEMLGWSPSRLNRYNNIQIPDPTSSSNQHKLEPIAASIVGPESRDTSRINQLVVVGPANQALRGIDSIKHRVDKDTTICLMSDGLGVLEEVRRSVFAGSYSTPNFLMGHMSHKLAFNRKFDAVKQLKSGRVMLTTPMPSGRTVSRRSIDRGVETRGNMVEQFRATNLQTAVTDWDKWLRFKLPSVIFSSVVDPVCVALELPYHGLLNNPSANRMMHQLAREIIMVMESLPELQDCSSVREFLSISQLQKYFHSAIVGKGGAPSNLVQQIKNGGTTDIHYLNGYFVRRGQRHGIDVKLNRMMMDMVLAKYSKIRAEKDKIIPFEETSIPTSLSGL